MSRKSAIEWTHSTWNPVTGCTKVSAGCDHCYAERFSERFRGVEGHPFASGFDLTLRPERLEQPTRWRRPHAHLRQFDERSLPQGRSCELHPARVRHDGRAPIGTSTRC